MMHNELGLEITDERKGHLAEAFRVLKDETDTKARKNMPEGVNRDEYLANAYRTMLVASLKEVHETYSEHVIPIIDHLRGHEPLTQEKAPVTKDRELSR
jgi:ubiquinone/menaquinone biosynthesis C-methylase UbiE